MFIDLSLLKNNRNFRNVFSAQVISNFGSQMTVVTIPFQIYHLTQSVFLTGLVGSVELVALIITALYGGVLSDRYDRKKIMMSCEILMIFGSLLLAGNAFLETPNLYVIFVLAFILSGLGGLHRPATEALLPAIVPKEQLASVSSLAPLRNIITSIVGPSIAGLILSQYGAVATYLIDGFTFFLSIVFLYFTSIPHIKLEESQLPAFWQEIKEGFFYLKDRKDILGTYAVDFCAMVFVSPQVLMPLIAKTFEADSYLGTLYAASATGGLLVALLSGWTKHVHRHGLAIAMAAAFWALSVGGVGFAGNIFLVILMLFLAGGFDMISGMFRMTMWNQTIPTRIRGRMASFEMLSYMSGPLLGQLFIGTTTDLLGYQSALKLGSGIALIAIGLICWRWKAFYRYSDN